jgi:hypothetical protein
LTWRAPPKHAPPPLHLSADMSALIRDVPVDPDADTARRWLEEELSKDIYRDDHTDWLQQVFDWINEQLGKLDRSAESVSVGDVSGSIIAGVIFTLLIAVLLYLVFGPLRRSRRISGSATVFDDDDRTASAMLASAEEAAARGDWDLAVLERFRSMVRRAEKRGTVAVVPGMTAYEFVKAAAIPLSDHAADLLWSGELFDGIRYGHASGSQEAYERMNRLAGVLSHAGLGVRS